MNFTRDDVRTIFGQMDLLIKFSSELLIDLKKCLPEFVRRAKKDVKNILKVLSEEQATQMCFQIAAVFIKYTPFMLFYTTYANNFATSQATLRRLRRQDPFKKWLFDQRIRSDELGLSDFLIKPVQRLLRYKLLLRTYLVFIDLNDVVRVHSNKTDDLHARTQVTCRNSQMRFMRTTMN